MSIDLQVERCLDVAAKFGWRVLRCLCYNCGVNTILMTTIHYSMLRSSLALTGSQDKLDCQY